MINYYYFHYYAANVNAAKKRNAHAQEDIDDNEDDITAETDEEKQQRQAVSVDSSNKTILTIDNQANLIDLTNQLVIIFGSFALGSLEHVTKLIKFYNLHEIIFNLIRILSFNEKKSNVDNKQTKAKDSGSTGKLIFLNTISLYREKIQFNCKIIIQPFRERSHEQLNDSLFLC